MAKTVAVFPGLVEDGVVREGVSRHLFRCFVLLGLVTLFGGAAVAADAIEAEFGWDDSELTLSFPEPMQTWGAIPDAEVLRLEPAVPVQCTWTDDLTLDCRPIDTARFTPATAYRIHLAPVFSTQQGGILPAQIIKAETDRPHVEASITDWRDAMPLIRLSSDAQISVQALIEVLQVTLDGQALPLTNSMLKERKASDQWGPQSAFDLRIAAQGIDQEMVVAIRPGLKGQAGELRGVQSKVLIVAHVNERLRVRRGSCQQAMGDHPGKSPEAGVLTMRCLPEAPIELVFSSRLDTESRARFVAALPAGISFLGWDDGFDYRYFADAKKSRPGSTARLIATEALSRFDWTLQGDLADSDGRRLNTPIAVSIHTDVQTPALRATGSRLVVADGRRLPVLAHSYNAQPVEVVVDTLDAKRGTATLTTPRTSATSSRAVTSRPTRRSLADGGWVHWWPGGRPARDNGGHGLQITAPDFDLLALPGGSEVLVWANAWEGDEPLARVGVELLLDVPGGDATVVATAHTDEDGLARLPAPVPITASTADPARPPQWVIRANHGAGRSTARAVLPAWRQGEWGVPLGRAPEQRAWGVVDRPLYRAGDRVQFRLWQREQHGNRLRAGQFAKSRELRLYEQETGKVIQRWNNNAGNEGSLSGDLKLPVHLTDGGYCIGFDEYEYEFPGACFYVGTYQAQDLWVEAQSAQAGVLRDGDAFEVDVTAGYYSGGPAMLSGGKVSTLLKPVSPAQAYPDYASFSFIDSDRNVAAMPLASEGTITLATDNQGRARLRLPVVLPSEEERQAPAFAQLQVVAELRLSDRDATASNAASAYYSGYDRFVGLKMTDYGLPASGPVSLQGVVIDAEGRSIPDVPVTVSVHFGSFDAEKPDTSTKALAQCQLVSGTATTCDFLRPGNGRYWFSAQADDAASAQLSRWYWQAGGERAAIARTELSLLSTPDSPGEPIQLQLIQPAETGRALLVMMAGDLIVGHQVVRLTGGPQLIELATQPDWRGDIQVLVFARDGAPSVVERGLRIPSAVHSDRVTVELPDPPVSVAPVTVTFDTGQATPGSRQMVHVHNHGKVPRHLTIAVVDDALLALAQDFRSHFDPHGEFWLGAVREMSFWPRMQSFGVWRDPQPWVFRLPWWRASRGSLDMLTSDDRAHDGLVPPPPPPPPPSTPSELRSREQDGGGDARSLDSISVTGSRIAPEDLFVAGSAVVKDLRPRETSDAAVDHQGMAAARLRTRFADTALWVPGLRLEPGQSQSFELSLPDNLTRWRAIVWSSDDEDDFHRAEAVVEVGLPVEVRLQAPVRVYPGDTTRIAANLRQVEDAPTSASYELMAEGAGVSRRHTSTLPLAARGQASIGLTLAPEQAGALDLIARAATTAGSDGVAARVEVAPVAIPARRIQAGWFDEQPRRLTLPDLPEGAHQARLDLRVMRGSQALIERWTDDLRDYRHRCWEQILSRAVAAALAVERGDIARWPDAQGAIAEAIGNAAVFQGEDGGFRFFARESDLDHHHADAAPQIVLTAYSVQGLTTLAELGHVVDGAIMDQAQRFLAIQVRGGITDVQDGRSNDFAFAAAAMTEPSPGLIDDLWRGWGGLITPSRIALTQAMLRVDHPSAMQAVQRLLGEASERGPVRVLQDRSDYSRWLSSPTRDQCALIEVVATSNIDDRARIRRTLIAGLGDLYAGGVQSTDTQTGAICLLALREPGPTQATDTIAVQAQLDRGRDGVITLPPDVERAEWQRELAGATTLTLAAQLPTTTPASYVAEVGYLEDARQASASAVGLSIERRYAVLRERGWVAVDSGGVREGDWLRITLVIRNGNLRHFVAVTDAVPGGLRPADLGLGAMAGLDLAQVSDTGSYWFQTRRLDARSPRFYAEQLPPGEHAIHYFARAGNQGDYLAAPASVELMYGDASHARTAATRLVVGSP